MKTIIVIPARYASTRLPGKPLMDISGKPMIWWVYSKCNGVKNIDQVIVATDSDKIYNYCMQSKIPVVMTSGNHKNHVTRIAEVASKISADYYICVNGDEPLIDTKNISSMIPKKVDNEIYANYSIRKLTSISEACDISNIKVVCKANGDVMYLSRNIIPYPKGSSDLNYFKLMGIECFNKKALDFYWSTKMSLLEKTEDIDHLRFVENGIAIHTTLVDSESISVDTLKDLEYVRKILEHE